MRTILRVFRYLRKYPGWALGTLGCALASTVLVIVFPKVTQLVVDEVREGRGERVWMLVSTAMAAFIARDGLNALRIILNNTFEQKVIFDLRSELYSHIQQLPLRWFDNRATGDLMTRVMEDVNSVERVLIDGIEQGAVAVLQVSIVTTMLLRTTRGSPGLRSRRFRSSQQARSGTRSPPNSATADSAKRPPR